MSLTLPEALGSIAGAQAMMVVPALGESYVGKSAGGLALLLMMLADGADARAGRRLQLAEEAKALLQAHGETLDAPECEGPDARMDRLMGMLGALLARVEATDREAARELRGWLVDWADNERLVLPPAQAGDA